MISPWKRKKKHTWKIEERGLAPMKHTGTHCQTDSFFVTVYDGKHIVVQIPRSEVVRITKEW